MSDAAPAAEGLAEEEDLNLTDIMLTMDVVDSLRHEEAMVERALNEEAREQLMVERVRDAYAAQGIEVSDATIAAGVKALKEKQFVYSPPQPGFKTRMLRAWVNRQGIGRGLGLFAGVGALIAGGWYGLVELPQARALAAEVSEFNTAVQVADVDLRALDQRRNSLTEAVEAADHSVRSEIEAGYRRELGLVERSLADAGRSLVEASQFSQGANYTTDNFSRLGDSAKRQREQQQALMKSAESALDDVDSGLGRLQRLRGLPAELVSLRDEAVELAVPAAVDRRAEAVFAAGQSALRQGDAAHASASADELKSLLTVLATEYRISVVSRPGSRSGVIRAPVDNNAVDNYYLIVEALDRANRPQRVLIQSEENGVSKQMTRWGLRVNERAFDQVRRDKEQDGIVDDKVVGEKKRGYLEPEYRIDTTGATITEWAD